MGLGVDIVLIVLLIAGFILYFSAKKQLRQGNRNGWLKWAEPYINVARAQSIQAPATGVQPNILGALDDLYREFMEETTGIREENAVRVEELRQTFEDRIHQLEVAVARLTDESAEAQLHRARATVATAVAPVVPPAASNDDTAASASVVSTADEPAAEQESEEERMAERKFEILDLLVQGFSPEAIASRLGVAVAEIHLVEQLMKQPGGSTSSNAH